MIKLNITIIVKLKASKKNDEKKVLTIITLPILKSQSSIVYWYHLGVDVKWKAAEWKTLFEQARE